MWEDPRSIISRQLAPQEQLLWSGKPASGIRLRASDGFLIPFSLMWGGFAIFWEIMAWRGAHGVEGTGRPAPFFMVLWGVPFVVIGLYMIFGRFIVDAKLRERTYYGVTNQRIIIVSGLFSPSVKSLNLSTLSDVTLTEKADGSGTITLGPTVPNTRSMAGMPWPGANRYLPPSFDMIENARQVHDIIRKAQREAAA